MAALTGCRDCKREISQYAKTCPHCGGLQKRYGWGHVLFFVFIGLAFYGLSTVDRSPSANAPSQKPSAYQGTGKCLQFIELHSAARLAQEMKTPESWVVANHTINVWQETTAQGRGRVVGKLLPGSRALLLETSGPDLKIRSPLDGSVGWVNQVQVAGLLMLNDKTFERCNP